MTPIELQATRDRQYDIFFEKLSQHGRITQAAREAGLQRESLYDKRERDPEFATRWANALETYADVVEAEVHRRAIEGTDKGIWHQGQLVGTERQFSDALLLALVKAKRAREFGDKSKLELTGADGGAVKVETSPLDLARRIGVLLSAGLAELDKPQPPEDGSDLA